MAIIQTHLEDCPKCESDDLRLWHSHYCQAFFVICNACGHEAGRERTEHETIDVWNREARQFKEPRP